MEGQRLQEEIKTEKRLEPSASNFSQHAPLLQELCPFYVLEILSTLPYCVSLVCSYYEAALSIACESTLRPSCQIQMIKYCICSLLND